MRIDEIRIKGFRAAGVDLSAHELAILLAFVLLLLAAAVAAYHLVGTTSATGLLQQP